MLPIYLLLVSQYVAHSNMLFQAEPRQSNASKLSAPCKSICCSQQHVVPGRAMLSRYLLLVSQSVAHSNMLFQAEQCFQEICSL